MVTLTEVVRQHGPEYLERHGAAVLPSHVRAIRAISQCRTAALGGHLAHCDSCNTRHVLFHSCGHRACPQCGGQRTARWLEQQRGQLLAVKYFHVVFTLPSELRRVVRQNQKALLPLLFRAAFDSLARLCRDPQFLGAEIGALAVLHTWTRTLVWHPHVHLLVPGGGLAPDGETWVPAPQRRSPYLVPQAALAESFKGRFMALARKALQQGQMPSVPSKKRWIVFAKPVVVGAEQVLEYFGRYVHKTAIGNHAVVAADEQSVTFRYTDSRTHQRKLMTLPPDELLRRFLQHVPQKGFHRVRSFGLLSSAKRPVLRRLQLLLPTGSAATKSSDKDPPEPERFRCPHCGKQTLVLERRLNAFECAELALQLASGLIVTSVGLASARGPPPTSGSCAEARVA